MPGDHGDFDATDRPVVPRRLQSIAGEDSIDETVVRGRDEDRIREELEEVHLPMLEEAGYVEWDRDSGTIEKGPKFDEVESLFDLLEEQ